MPVLGQHHMVEAFRQPVDHGYNFITGADRKRATRAEIVLNVDDEQQFVAGPGLHLHLHLRGDWLFKSARLVSAARIAFGSARRQYQTGPSMANRKAPDELTLPHRRPQMPASSLHAG